MLFRSTINAGGIVDGAGYLPRVTSGGIASVFGLNLATSITDASKVPLPTTLAEASVRLNGIAAPLFFVSPQQINFQVPWELVAQPAVLLTVSVSGTTSSASQLTLPSYAPGLFSINASGRGQGAILISGTGGGLAAPAGTASLSRPVRPGEFIEIYASGLGPVTNQPATGAVTPGSQIGRAHV